MTEPYRKVVMVPVPQGTTPELFLSQVKGALGSKASLVYLNLLVCKTTLDSEYVNLMGEDTAREYAHADMSKSMANGLLTKGYTRIIEREKRHQGAREFSAYLVTLTDPDQVRIKDPN